MRVLHAGRKISDAYPNVSSGPRISYGLKLYFISNYPSALLTVTSSTIKGTPKCSQAVILTLGTYKWYGVLQTTICSAKTGCKGRTSSAFSSLHGLPFYRFPSQVSSCTDSNRRSTQSHQIQPHQISRHAGWRDSPRIAGICLVGMDMGNGEL